MASKKTTDTDIDFEELLGADAEHAAEEAAEATVESAPEELKKTAAQRRIEELQAALEAPDPNEPTEEEQAQIDMLADALARKNAARVLQAEDTYGSVKTPEESPNIIRIHFVVGGFTAFGTIWDQGQEIDIDTTPGSDDYKRTQDVNGVSWLDLLDNPQGQKRRWGKVYFARGSYEWTPGEEFDTITAQADARRNRRVPLSAAI